MLVLVVGFLGSRQVMGPKASKAACDRAKELKKTYLEKYKNCVSFDEGEHVHSYSCLGDYLFGSANYTALPTLEKARVKDYLVIDKYADRLTEAEGLAATDGDFSWGGREKCTDADCSKGVGMVDGTYFEWNIAYSGPRYDWEADSGWFLGSYSLGRTSSPGDIETPGGYAGRTGDVSNGPRQIYQSYYFPEYCFVLENADLYAVGGTMSGWWSIHSADGRFNCTEKKKYADVDWPIPTYSEPVTVSLPRTGEPFENPEKKWKYTSKCGPETYSESIDYEDGEHYVVKDSYIDFWGRFTLSVDVKDRIGKVKLSKGIGNKLSVGAMIGIVVAVAAVLTVIGLLILYFACVSK